MPRRTEQWNVRQLLARLNATEHQTAPAHVSPADKFRREQKLFAEDCQQRLDIFRRGNTSQKDDLTALAADSREALRVVMEQTSIPII
jgi:hypothetical protein